MLQITSLRRSLQIQMRVIGALLMREVITRFGRQNLGVLWMFGEPMLFTIGVATLWTLAKLGHGSNMPIVAFAITGYSSVLLWRNTVNRCNSAVQANAGLLYHRNVRVLDVFLARILLEIGGCTISFVLLILVCVAAEVVPPPVDPLTVLGGWLMLAWFGASLSILVGAATAYSETVERFWHPIAYLVFPLSGAMFMVDWLPRDAQEIVLWLPMVHGVEMLRDGYFGHVIRTHYDLAYMSAVNLVILMFGLLLLRDAAYRVEAQ